MFVKTLVKLFNVSASMIVDLSLFSEVRCLNLDIISPTFYQVHILYFVAYLSNVLENNKKWGN